MPKLVWWRVNNLVNNMNDSIGGQNVSGSDPRTVGHHHLRRVDDDDDQVDRFDYIMNAGNCIV